MKAMVLSGVCKLKDNPQPLQLVDLPVPTPTTNELLIRVATCGVCHTELDEIEGRTPPQAFPIVLGHQVIGEVVECGNKCAVHQVGDRVGAAWIFSACGHCDFCISGNENLCPKFQATGRDVQGGYAEYMTVPDAFAVPIPEFFSDTAAAPLLCAGAIGYRSLRLSGIENGQRLGLTGFGASGHLVMKMIRHRCPDSDVYIFARSQKEQEFGLELGAHWAGDTAEAPPELLDAIIDTTPVWKPICESLKFLRPNGRLVINAIRKEDSDKQELLKLNYEQQLWMEKEIKSVANVARRDVTDFLELAADMQLQPEVEEFPLGQANAVLLGINRGVIRGAKVLRIS